MTTMSEAPNWHLHYESGVPRSIEIPDIPLYRILDDNAARYPHRTALHFILRYLPLGIIVGSKMSYAKLKAASDRFAAALHNLGVRPGDRVAVMLPNVPQQVIAFFGILKAGAILVNVNPTYTPREVHHLVSDSGAETMITLSGLYARVEEIRPQTNLMRVILTDIVDSLPWQWRILAQRQVRDKGMMVDVAPAPHIHDFTRLLRQAPSPPPTVSYAPDDVILLQYSGGTTGTPKAAMLTHRNVVANVKQIRSWLTFVTEGKENVLGALPFFHSYGMTVGMLTAINLASRLVVVPDPRQIDLILEIISNEQITFYPGVPAMYMGIINHPRVHDYNLRSVNGCMSGGTSLPAEVTNRFEALTGGDLVEGYGLSEASPVAIANPIRNVPRRPLAIGLPIPNTSVEIVALQPDETGEYPPMPLGEPGELIVYGPQVMKGYWNAPDETKRAINSRGGLHTGDIARMDEDGFIYIVDRKKDLIIASGYNIVPREVEEVLFSHPKVLEAVVAGIPDARRGETVKAYLVLKDGERSTEEEIRTFCKQYLAPYKVPYQVEFRKELPKSLVGKVMRRLLVEEEIIKQEIQETQQEPTKTTSA